MGKKSDTRNRDEMAYEETGLSLLKRKVKRRRPSQRKGEDAEKEIVLPRRTVRKTSELR